jgi:hypothetical protein
MQSRPSADGDADQLFVIYKLESLILAQIERWRRA